MAFKDVVTADRAKMLDIEFFGESVRVEGRSVNIVLDNDELKVRKGGQDLAVADSATLFYAQTEDLPPRRAPGQNLNINGRECLVDDWQEDMGVSAVVLHENIVT